MEKMTLVMYSAWISYSSPTDCCFMNGRCCCCSFSYRKVSCIFFSTQNLLFFKGSQHTTTLPLAALTPLHILVFCSLQKKGIKEEAARYEIKKTTKKQL